MSMKYLTYIFITGLILLVVGCATIKSPDCEDLAVYITQDIERKHGLAEEIINIRDTTDDPRINDLLSLNDPPSNRNINLAAKDVYLICYGEANMVHREHMRIEFWKATGKDGILYRGWTNWGNGFRAWVSYFPETATPYPAIATPYSAIDVKNLTSQYQYDPVDGKKSDFKKRYQGKNLQIYVKGLYLYHGSDFNFFITYDEIIEEVDVSDYWPITEEDRTSILNCVLAKEARYQYNQVGTGDTVIVTGILVFERTEFNRPDTLKLEPCNVVQIDELPLTPTPAPIPPTPTPASVIPTPIIN